MDKVVLIEILLQDKKVLDLILSNKGTARKLYAISRIWLTRLTFSIEISELNEIGPIYLLYFWNGAHTLQTFWHDTLSTIGQGCFFS